MDLLAEIPEQIARRDRPTRGRRIVVVLLTVLIDELTRGVIMGLVEQFSGRVVALPTIVPRRRMPEAIVRRLLGRLVVAAVGGVRGLGRLIVAAVGGVRGLVVTAVGGVRGLERLIVAAVGRVRGLERLIVSGVGGVRGLGRRLVVAGVRGVRGLLRRLVVGLVVAAV
jgi:hypothetical protein